MPEQLIFGRHNLNALWNCQRRSIVSRSPERMEILHYSIYCFVLSASMTNGSLMVLQRLSALSLSENETTSVDTVEKEALPFFTILPFLAFWKSLVFTIGNKNVEKPHGLRKRKVQYLLLWWLRFTFGRRLWSTYNSLITLKKIIHTSLVSAPTWPDIPGNCQSLRVRSKKKQKKNGDLQ